VPVSSRLDFLDPTLAFDRCRPGPSRVSRRCAPTTRTEARAADAASLTFTAPFARSSIAGTPRDARGRHAFLPLWIHGVYRPSTVSPRVCPLPARDKSQTFGPTVPTVSSRSVHVVLPHLNGFLHTSRLRACCIPLPVLRFAGFLTSRSHPRFHSRKSLAKDGAAVAVLPYAHTPRRIPLSRSRTVSPRPIPPCRYHSATCLRRDASTSRSTYPRARFPR
jgi:hypothetical protein